MRGIINPIMRGRALVFPTASRFYGKNIHTLSRQASPKSHTGYRRAFSSGSNDAKLEAKTPGGTTFAAYGAAVKYILGLSAIAGTGYSIYSFGYSAGYKEGENESLKQSRVSKEEHQFLGSVRNRGLFPVTVAELDSISELRQGSSHKITHQDYLQYEKMKSLLHDLPNQQRLLSQIKRIGLSDIDRIQRGSGASKQTQLWNNAKKEIWMIGITGQELFSVESGITHIEKALQRGVNVNVLIMDPNSADFSDEDLLDSKHVNPKAKETIEMTIQKIQDLNKRQDQKWFQGKLKVRFLKHLPSFTADIVDGNEVRIMYRTGIPNWLGSPELTFKATDENDNTVFYFQKLVKEQFNDHFSIPLDKVV